MSCRLDTGRAVPGSAATPGSRRTLSGWGGWPRSRAEVVRPASIDQLMETEASTRGMVPRGLGRSYGDAAQLSGGTVVDMTGLGGVEELTPNGAMTAWGGTSLDEILSAVIPRGWFLPVSPGTRHVTLGGAIAADVHGKNHHRDGSFGSHLERFELLTGDRSILEVEPGEEVFRATVGGMGLTGVITQATLQLQAIETAWMSVDTRRADDLDQTMAMLVAADSHRRYSVAWVDLSRRGRGRSIVLAADHAPLAALPPSWQDRPLGRLPEPGIPVPEVPGPGLVNRATISVFNSVWFGRAPRLETDALQPMDRFFYPLDRLQGWNRVYGWRGFLQYQFVVPPHAVEALRDVAAILSAGAPVSLAVLKRMGPAADSHISFPMEGWTLAADIPLGAPGLRSILDRCDHLVAAAGGRVYLAKDSRMLPDTARAMYPGLESWGRVKARLDPRGALRSDLSDRLGLTG